MLIYNLHSHLVELRLVVYDKCINRGRKEMNENNSQPEAPAPAPQPAPVAPVQAPQPAPAGPTNGLAVAALIVGIVAVVSGWIPVWGVLVGAAAIVLGVLGLRKATGKGMAIAGLITGAVGALWALVVTGFFIFAIVTAANVSNSISESVKEQNKESQALIDSKKDFSKGETANFAGKFEVKVNSVDKGYDAGEYYTPAAGKEYIRVNITVKNIGDESEYLKPYSFAVVDNGIVVTNSYAPSDEELTVGDLQAGASSTGYIVYETTTGASDLKLQFEENVFDESYKSKKLVYTLAF